MSFGKSGGTTVQTPQLTQEQKDQIAAQTGFFTGTIAPTYQQAVTGATNLYNQGAPGVTNAAQNYAQTAGQAQETLGGTGESALRTGISGLENLFSNDYEQQQLQAAMSAPEMQYQQNLAAQNAQFGGAGNLGSARQALAQTQLAGQTQALQQQAAAGVLKDIAAQRLAAGQALTGAGQTNLTGAQAAAANQIAAAMTPQQLYNQYASVIFGTPSTSYNPSFAGTQGVTSTTTGYGVKTNPISF